MKKILLLFLLLVVENSTRAQVLFGVYPSDTDSTINNPNNVHIICTNTTVPAKNKLFLFLPGTGGTPAGYMEILKTAADMGYHAIGLMYPNAQAINAICAGSTDTTCHSRARQEVLEGVDLHATITVDPTNCIENRLIRLLKYLDVLYPLDGWHQYMVNDTTLTWTNYIVSGHSQGGGHAGFIGKVRSVTRVAMFSATDWIPLLNRNADWITMPGLTPVSDYYALIHDQDEQISFSIEQTTWLNYGLFNYGSLVKVDTAITPYGNSRTLYTQLTPNLSATAFHNAPVVDIHTPVDSLGNYLLEPVWQYMIEGGALSSIEQSSYFSFNIFPNPAQTFIRVEAETPFTYVIYELSGRMRKNGIATTNQIELIEEPGLYILSISNKHGTSTNKLLIH